MPSEIVEALKQAYLELDIQQAKIDGLAEIFHDIMDAQKEIHDIAQAIEYAENATVLYAQIDCRTSRTNLARLKYGQLLTLVCRESKYTLITMKMERRTTCATDVVRIANTRAGAFCKPECQTEWNKIRDATARAAKIKRNREAEIERAARDMERIGERLKIKQEMRENDEAR